MLTFGHGSLDRDQLAGLLTGAGVEQVVDVRRFPGSRHNPAAGRDEFPALLAELGIDYRWDPRLGGRRHLTKDEDELSPDTFWRVPAFRAYAGWTREPEFIEGLAQLLDEASRTTTAAMCSEAVWWRCHRRLISDVAALGHGHQVQHLMHSGQLRPHPICPGARLLPDGQLVWDGVNDQVSAP